MNENEWLEAQPKKSKKPWIYALIGLLLCALIAAGGFFWINQNNTNTDNQTATDVEKGNNLEKGNTEQTNTTSNIQTEPISADEVNLQMGLQDLEFYLNGTVSSQATADEIKASIQETFGEFNKIDLKVNPNATPLPWEKNTPELITSFIGIIEGDLEITKDQASMTGSAPKDLFYLYFQSQISEAKDFPPFDNQIEELNKRPPTIVTSVTKDTVTVEGELESIELKESIIQDYNRLFPDKEIQENIEVNDEVFTRISLRRTGTVVSVLTAFPEFTIGLKNDQLFAVIEEGLEFESNSAELNLQRISGMRGILFLLQTPLYKTTITGHTDNVGNDEDNLELSKQRAQAVADALISLGTPEELLIVEGKGESEPIASNDTEEGKGRNRRVELRLNADATTQEAGAVAQE